MKRLAAICWMITATLAVTMVFQISSEVQKREAELAALQRETTVHEEAVRVLQAEWSYLNRPAQIADLARRHLELKPLTAEQFIEFADLPPRAATEDGLVRNDDASAKLASTEAVQ